MQNPEEFLYHLISAKAFEELTHDERVNVLMHLTENEYRDCAIIINSIGESVTIPAINPDIRFKKSLDKKVDSLKPKTRINFYKIAACIAIFFMISFFSIRKATSPTQKANIQQTAKKQEVNNSAPVVIDAIKSVPSIKIIKPSIQQRSIVKKASVKPLKNITTKEKAGDYEEKKTDAIENQLAFDIDLTPFLEPCLNPENTQANDVTSQLLRL